MSPSGRQRIAIAAAALCILALAISHTRSVDVLLEGALPLGDYTRYLEGRGGVHHQMRSRMQRAVACTGESSVGCVVQNAESGIEGDMAKPPDTPGRDAVAAAARGRGFRAWPGHAGTQHIEGVKEVAKAARGRSRGGFFGVFRAIGKEYDEVDREIDDGGSESSRRAGEVSRRKRTAARADMEASIKVLKAEKARLSKVLSLQRAKSQARRARKDVRKVTGGWLDGLGGWLHGDGDVKEKAQPWDY